MATIKQLSFNENDGIEKAALDILSQCPRKQALLISIALKELDEKYSILAGGPKKAKKFLEFYSFIRSSDYELPDRPEVKEVRTKKPSAPEPVIKQNALPSNELINSDEKNEMKDIMANIFLA